MIHTQLLKIATGEIIFPLLSHLALTLSQAIWPLKIYPEPEKLRSWYERQGTHPRESTTGKHCSETKYLKTPGKAEDAVSWPCLGFPNICQSLINLKPIFSHPRILLITNREQRHIFPFPILKFPICSKSESPSYWLLQGRTAIFGSSFFPVDSASACLCLKLPIPPSCS